MQSQYAGASDGVTTGVGGCSHELGGDGQWRAAPGSLCGVLASLQHLNFIGRIEDSSRAPGQAGTLGIEIHRHNTNRNYDPTSDRPDVRALAEDHNTEQPHKDECEQCERIDCM
jgi:hypothetical protein